MAKGRNVKRSEAEKMIAAWRESGEPMSQWCEQRGVNWYSLNAFNGRRIRPPPVFAEVVMGHTQPKVAAKERRYRIDLGDVVVEVNDGFHTDTLRRLLGLVRSC